MLTREELDKQAAADRRAKELADRGGTRPGHDVLTVSVATAIGVFVLLDIFANITLRDRDAAFWPVVVMTAICGGGAGIIQWWREKAWWRRYSKALSEIDGA